jgi:hypothetical protein
MFVKKVDVIIIGGGPIGLLNYKILKSAGLKVCIIIESNKAHYTSSNGNFKLKNDKKVSGLYGKTTLWGNGHDTNLNYYLNLPNTSNFPRENLNLAELKNAAKKLEKLGWPSSDKVIKRNSKLSQELSKNGFVINEIKRGRLSTPIDTKIDDKDIIYANSHQINCSKNKGKKKVKTLIINYEDSSIIIDTNFLVLSAGGLGNLVLLKRISSELNTNLQEEIIGKGYSNHPKMITHTLYLKKRMYVGSARYLLKKWKPFEIADFIKYDLMNTRNFERNLRISLRYWPNKSKINPQKNYVLNNIYSFYDKVMLKAGWALSLDIMCYFEMPQKKSNYIKLQKHSKSEIDLSIKHRFTTTEKIFIKKSIHTITNIFESMRFIRQVNVNKINFKSLENMDSSHYFGTTRMSANKRFGVTNLESLVYGTKNIYCSGTSVLPLSSPNHPTWLAAVFAIIMCDSIIEKSKKIVI